MCHDGDAAWFFSAIGPPGGLLDQGATDTMDGKKRAGRRPSSMREGAPGNLIGAGKSCRKSTARVSQGVGRYGGDVEMPAPSPPSFPCVLVVHDVSTHPHLGWGSHAGGRSNGARMGISNSRVVVKWNAGASAQVRRRVCSLWRVRLARRRVSWSKETARSHRGLAMAHDVKQQ